MAQNFYKEIYNLIRQKERILIMPSTPPDGDGLGCALALYLVLKKMGKEATVVCADPVPDALLFMPTSSVVSNQFAAKNDFIVTLDCSRSSIESIKAKIENDKVNIIITPKDGNLSARGVSFSHGASEYDLIIIVDTGDLQQLGKFYEDNTELFTRIPVINIDHHTSNSMFGRINLVDIMAPSASEVVTKLIESFPKGSTLIDEDVATLLLAGIITDTGSFQNSNTTPRAFAAASHLLGYGARQQEIIQNIYKTKNLSTLKLWGRVLTKLRTDEKYKIVWSTITHRDLEETHSHADETGDIIDELMTNAPGAEIVLLIKEKADGLVSVSVRTTHAGVDASELAERFGGGGHVQAAGFRVKGETIEEAEKEVIEGVREFQKDRLYIPEDEDEAATLEAGAAVTPAEIAVAKAKNEEMEVPVIMDEDDESNDFDDQTDEFQAEELDEPLSDSMLMKEAEDMNAKMMNENDEEYLTDEFQAEDNSVEPLFESVNAEPENTEMTKRFFESNEPEIIPEAEAALIGPDNSTPEFSMPAAPIPVTETTQTLQSVPSQPTAGGGEVLNVQPGVEFDLEPNKMFKVDGDSA